MKFRWKFKIFVKIDNENEKIESNSSNNSKNFSELNQSKNSNDVDFNLNFTRSKIQKLRNSQSLFSFSKHNFSFNTSQFFSNTSINSGENGQNEIDENDFLSELNLFQQNIQKIVLSMFNLFRDNIAFKNDTSNNSFNNDDWKGSFRAQNVKFFDFILNETYGSDDVIQVERNVYYKNVYFFVKRIKNAVNMYIVNKIRFNLFSCLKKIIQIWYIKDLSDFEKKILRSLNIGVEKWCDVLIKKFKQFVFFVLQFFLSESYFLDDLKNKKDMFSFVFSVMRHAKAINIANVHDQLIWVYNAIAFELAKDIDFSKKIISILIFFKQFDNKREIWFCIYFCKFNKNSSEYKYQFFFKYQNFYFKYEKENKGIYKQNQNQSQIVERQKWFLIVSSNEKFNEDNQIQTSDRTNENEKNAFSSEQKNIQSVDSFWYRQFLKNYNFEKKKNYRNEYIFNNYDRRRRKNYRFNRWQNNRYENREQYQKTYASEKRFYEKKFFESYENIDFNEKFDDEKSAEFYSYNFHSKSSNVCKKCDKSKKNFLLITLFIVIFVIARKKNR